MPDVFLRAEWRKLALANYPVEAATLRSFLPAKTELDTWEGDPYVSLVGFQFNEIRVKGFRVPYHTHFPEVNLRFYVRYKEGEAWKRGVVFISEIVPRRAVAFVANTIFRERYMCLPMRFVEAKDGETLRASYHWRYKGRWNGFSVKAGITSNPMAEASQEEFITQHFWGYAKASRHVTNEYQVAHPRWEVYPVSEYLIDCAFGQLYGSAFDELTSRKPQSVFLAEGSAVEVYSKLAK